MHFSLIIPFKASVLRGLLERGQCAGKALDLTRDDDLGGLAFGSLREGFEGLDLQDGLVGARFLDKLDTFGIRLLDLQDGFRLAFGLADHGFALCFGAEDGRLLVGFSVQNGSFLITFGNQDGGLLFTFGLQDLLTALR